MKEIQLLKQTALALMQGQTRAAQDPHRPGWHLAPPVGLLNDPNGFIQFAGRYHLFYQWNPLACAHGAKFWGHWSSADLLSWRHEPVALTPAEAYESHGCYSGSAVDDNGVLTLIYTGNVKFTAGRTAWQCLATLDEKGDCQKLGPVLALPEGYSGHVRDPKVWRHDGAWYMVLGAQDLAGRGKVLLLRGETLQQWQLLGEIAGSGLNGLGDFGYMWECPDLFRLGERDVLIVCPQGLPAQETRWLNTFQSGYFIGTLDYPQARYTHGDFQELDLGFEFYAPQTTLSDDGRRLMFGWMGIPDGDEFYQPTLAHGWIHQMTCPRELTLQQDRLLQRPARELQQLRGAQRRLQGAAQQLETLDIASAELLIAPEGALTAHFGDALRLDYRQGELRLSRRNLRSGQQEDRYWLGALRQLHIFCDRSSVEIFINDGEAVMSARYFPADAPRLRLEGEAKVTLDYWRLEPGVIV
ncbi:sucrose-6-phosphate hydrolase [Mixta gaviniae]|uniref:Sucrose-6-phosphate hydrolase n=1 Tax=Mixta gaviniae TaxID=665914 RepID=A0A2L0IKD1_9GAMM|nr:sucrose-6-phosphate hydrolase [Mixta gaviniae]AUX95051.1 glycosyl hydrolase family 32 [Mixta gaviniae]